METRSLPSEARMAEAFLGGDADYDGIFWAGVRTTGIFCRPGCSARKPLRAHLSFFATPEAAMAEGYRPCKRCRPLEPRGRQPDWLSPLMHAVDADLGKRWTERDLRSFGVAPERIRRWFQAHHGMTFQAYHRARRLGSALAEVQNGSPVSRAAFESGYESLSGFQEAFRSAFGAPPKALEDVLILRVTSLPSPLGPMMVAASAASVHLLEFADRNRLQRQIRRTERLLAGVFVPAPTSLADRVGNWLGRYFEGHAEAFDLPVEPAGTPFQRDVWARLREIPRGETVTYADIAASLGRPKAARAVGTAVGANPLAIVVPCHRVVGSDGRLTGYAGGVWRKRRLLDLEVEL